MKFICSLILMALLSFAAGLYFPWWSVAVSCFLVAALLPQRAGLAFFTGFLALFLLWAGMSFWISSNNDHILAHKISLIVLKNDNPILLILITGLIGGITGGFAALTGSLLRRSRQRSTKTVRA